MKKKLWLNRFFPALAIVLLAAAAINGLAFPGIYADKHEPISEVEEFSSCAIAMDANGNPIMTVLSNTSDLELLSKSVISALESVY